jgi:excisionase family DNA binding protein
VSAGLRESVFDRADVLTVHQAASLLQIGPKMVRRLCAANRLRHVSIDGRGTIRTTRAWVADYLERASRPVVQR